MSHVTGRREAHGEAGRGMYAAGLLRLGLAPSAAATVCPARGERRPRSAAPSRRPRGATASSRIPAEFKRRGQSERPTTLSFWQYVGFHVDAQKFIAEEYKRRTIRMSRSRSRRTLD